MLEVVRSLPLDVDVDVVGRRLAGSVFRWDTLYRVSDDGGASWYEEGFLRGAAAYSLRARRNTFEFRPEHLDERAGLVRFLETDDGLDFEATLDGTETGDRELMDVQGGMRRGVSIRYQPKRNNPRTGPPWWRSEIGIRELSLTGAPQYGTDAQVTAVRSHQPPVREYKRPADLDALLTYQVPVL